MVSHTWYTLFLRADLARVGDIVAHRNPIFNYRIERISGNDPLRFHTAGDTSSSAYRPDETIQIIREK